MKGLELVRKFTHLMVSITLMCYILKVKETRALTSHLWATRFLYEIDVYSDGKKRIWNICCVSYNHRTFGHATVMWMWDNCRGLHALKMTEWLSGHFDQGLRPEHNLNTWDWNPTFCLNQDWSQSTCQRWVEYHFQH